MYDFKIKKCTIKGSKVLAIGETKDLSIKEMAKTFAPSGDPKARRNVLAVRTGDYIGFVQNPRFGKVNFICGAQGGSGNDFTVLFDKNPDLKGKILEIYFIEDVIISKDIQVLE